MSALINLDYPFEKLDSFLDAYWLKGFGVNIRNDGVLAILCFLFATIRAIQLNDASLMVIPVIGLIFLVVWHSEKSLNQKLDVIEEERIPEIDSIVNELTN